jgi:hypothetical protein
MPWIVVAKAARRSMGSHHQIFARQGNFSTPARCSPFDTPIVLNGLLSTVGGRLGEECVLELSRADKEAGTMIS